MATVVQRSFSGGEIAPTLYARVDTAKYANGLRTCRNNIVMRHGGTQNRPGSTFVGEVKDSTKSVRLIRFVFSSSQTYVLEFGNEYMRVIRDGSHQYDLTLTITGISNANPGVVTYTGTDPVAGEEVYISGVLGPLGKYVNNRNFKVGTVDGVGNTFQLKDMAGVNFNTTALGLYSSAGTASRVYQISTPYLEAHLPYIRFDQSADVITLVHPSYAVRELSRAGHTSWTLSTVTFAPSAVAPSSSGSVSGTGGAETHVYHVTTIAQTTFEESLAYVITQGSLTEPSVAEPHTIGWNTVSGAQEYNVYHVKNGVPGLIGVAGGTSFINDGIPPDPLDTPPTARNPFPSSDNYPSAVAYLQQRHAFANTNNDPEALHLSRSGRYKNFTVSRPSQDDDAITAAIVGSQVNRVMHLFELGKPVVLTDSGEWVLDGGSAGILNPGEINPRQQSYNGSGDRRPIIIGSTALYVQADSAIVRDLGYALEKDGLDGSDLTVFSAHLVDGYTIDDWDFQKTPHSIVWCVRGDGTLLGLTYVREQQMLAWHRHDFDGYVENVCCVPEDGEYAVYLTVLRTVNGTEKRYIERMTQRRVDDIVDSIFMDSSLTYDGRNTGSRTMTLSGSGWTYTDTLTLTASTAYFTSDDVGNEIHLTGSDGTLIRFTISGYTSTTIVTGRPHKTVPVAMQAAAMLTWTRAVDEITGLWHLEAKAVSILGDGFVVASPNNASYDVVTVTNGTVTLDKCYGVLHIGLPYTSDIETLDIDSAQGESIVNTKKNISQVTVYVEKSRGLWIGAAPPTDDDDDPLEGLTELKIRNSEGYDEPVGLLTGTSEVNIRPEWNSNGRVFVRQVDPLPMSILAVAPTGFIAFKG